MRIKENLPFKIFYLLQALFVFHLCTQSNGQRLTTGTESRRYGMMFKKKVYSIARDVLKDEVYSIARELYNSNFSTLEREMSNQLQGFKQEIEQMKLLKEEAAFWKQRYVDLSQNVHELTQNLSVTRTELELVLREQSRQNSTINDIIKKQVACEKALQRMTNDSGVTDVIYSGPEITHTSVESEVKTTIENATQKTMSFSSAPAVTFSSGTLPSYDINCKVTTEGKEYRGTVSVTVSGKLCQRWDSQYPHSHSMTSKFKEPVSIHENYCRNPDGDSGGPWCYTTDSSKRWEYCDIKICDGYQTTEMSTSMTTTESATIVVINEAFCTFEPQDDCFLENFTKDDFDWTTRTGNTPSSDTGPSSASGGLYYSYIEVSEPRKTGDTASLVSKELIAGGQKCLQFDYHMRGGDMGTFKVFTFKENTVNEIFSRSGEQGNDWNSAVIPLTSVESYKLRFDGIKGSDFEGDIAIDNIRILQGNCDKNCKVATMGTEYRGTVSVTVSGKLCQRWDSQNPHSHSMTSKFKEPVSIHENYCRNPDKDSGGPWCYTTDPSKRWEYCDIRMCDVTNMIYRGSEGTSTNAASIVTSTIKDDTQDIMSHSSAPAVTFSRGTLPPSSASSYMNCKATTMGKEYRGTVSMTTSGIPCQRWDSQNPRSHSMASKFNEPASIHQNYCRNPDDDTGGPWCFTTYSSKTWEYCDIKMCDSLMASEETKKVTFLPTQSVSTGSEHLTTETHESSIFETTIYPFDDYQTTEITTSVSTHESTIIAELSRASCTFEPFEICFLENSIRDDFNWTTEKDSTPSSDTGPSSASGGLYYSYIETSDPRKSGETASLVSKEFIAGGQKCLLFDYHMRGNGIGTLKVFIIKGSAVDEIFSRSGEQGNNWVTAVIPLTSAENYKLRIDGTRGRNFRGDIAIDNVRVVPKMGNCDQLVMRLVGGNSKHEGRIEVYAQAKWGTICDDDFDNNDGLVVCRMLGFSRVLSVKGSAYFGQGTGSILMDDVACSGSESSIFQCTYKSAHNCGHSEDVGVRCE